MNGESQSKTGVKPPTRAKDQSTTPPPATDGLNKTSPKSSRRANASTRDENLAQSANGQAGNTHLEAAELSQQMARVAEKSREIVAEFLRRQAPEERAGMASPLAIGAAFLEMTARMMSDPSRLVQAQLSLWNDYLTLWQRTTQQ